MLWFLWQHLATRTAHLCTCAVQLGEYIYIYMYVYVCECIFMYVCMYIYIYMLQLGITYYNDVSSFIYLCQDVDYIQST